MANSLDELTNPPAEQDPVVRNGRIYVTPEGSGGNNLERNVQAAPQEDLGTLLGRLRDYLLNPEGFSSGAAPVNRAVNRLLGTGGEERVQTWPERMIRSGLSLPGDVMSGAEPFYVTDPDTGERTISPRVIERSMDTAGLAVPGALAQKPGTATLGSGPVRQAAAVPKTETPVFYSALEHNVINAPQAVMEPQQWLGWIKKQPGVKQEELQWTGLPEWLEGQKGKVSKEDVARYLGEHKVEVKDVTKSTTRAEDFDDMPRDQFNQYVEQYRRETGNDPTSPEDVVEYFSAPRGHDGVVKYGDYQLSGGENYREHLLTLPAKERPLITRNYLFKDGQRVAVGDENAVARWRERDPNADVRQVQEPDDRAIKREGEYRSSHWDEPNVLAHVRTNDRLTPRDNKGLLPEDKAALADYRAEYGKLMSDYEAKWAGKWDDPARPSIAEYTQSQPFQDLRKRFSNYDLDRLQKLEEHGDTDLVPTLHLEEIQSDWHQQGRKQGYKDKPLDPPTQAVVRKTPTGDYWEVQNKDGGFITNVTDPAITTAEQAIAEANRRIARDPRRVAADNRVPDAPFKTAWPELALKRMIRMAAEEGKSRISWTPGEAQAARYDLSKHFDHIDVVPEGDTRTWWPAKRAGNITNAGESITTDANGKITKAGRSYGDIIGKNIDDVIGKDLAEKGMKTNKETRLSGLDLKVGGEGMKGFYDNMLPKMVEKLGKPYGVKVKKGYTGSFRELNIEKDGDVYTVREKGDSGNYGQFPSREAAQAKINDMNKDAQPVWYFDIPEAWRDQALGKGFPLFAQGVPFPLVPVDYDPFEKKK